MQFSLTLSRTLSLNWGGICNESETFRAERSGSSHTDKLANARKHRKTAQRSMWVNVDGGGSGSGSASAALAAGALAVGVELVCSAELAGMSLKFCLMS